MVVGARTGVVVGIVLVLLAACSSDPPHSVAADGPPPASVCDAFQANPGFVNDAYLLQIADRADDPAEATELAIADPEGELATRQATLATLRAARPFVAAGDPLGPDLDLVIATYEKNIEGLTAVAEGKGGFLPVGAGMEIVVPAGAVFDHATTTCGLASTG